MNGNGTIVDNRLFSFFGLGIYLVVCIVIYAVTQGLYQTSIKFMRLLQNGELMFFSFGLILGLLVMIPYALISSLRKRVQSVWITFALLFLIVPLAGQIVYSAFMSMADHPELSFSDFIRRSLANLPSLTVWASMWMSVAGIGFCVAVVAAGSVFLGNRWALGRRTA